MQLVGGREESLGNDDVLALKTAERPQVRNGLDDVKQNSPRDRLGWFCDSHCKVILKS